MRICSGAGCLRAVRDDVRFCDDCLPQPAPKPVDGIRTHTTGYDAEIHKLASSPRWQRTRKAGVQRQPLCARCEIRFTEIVDHIVPAEIAIIQARDSGLYPFDRWAGYFLTTNHQGLCRPCHGLKTAEDKAHTGPWPNVVEKERLTPKKAWSF